MYMMSGGVSCVCLCCQRWTLFPSHRFASATEKKLVQTGSYWDVVCTRVVLPRCIATLHVACFGLDTACRELCVCASV